MEPPTEGLHSLPANREVAAKTRQRIWDGTDKRDRICGVLFSTSTNYTLWSNLFLKLVLKSFSNVHRCNDKYVVSYGLTDEIRYTWHI